MKVSVIIPTLNERDYLPRLLHALRAQTHPPHEIIIADAGSVDGTPDLAGAFGAQVVAGGMPAIGRNAGARHANGEILLFLDADVLPGPFFLERTINEMQKRQLDVATCLYHPLEEDPLYSLLTEMSNLFLQVMAPLSPHAPGFCIFVRRSIHEAIGGFDEKQVMAEDHDYVQRAARRGKFGILRQERLRVSMRRLEKEGLLNLGLKYLWCEMHVLAGRPIHSIPFKYEFGAFSDLARRQMWEEAYTLSRYLKRIESPLAALSQQTLESLRRLAEEEAPDHILERLRAALTLRELDILHRYLRRRWAVLFHPRLWRRRWQHLRQGLRPPLRRLSRLWERNFRYHQHGNLPE
ncbi:MAG: glycosyltransferase [Anaerolineales bacterium]